MLLTYPNVRRYAKIRQDHYMESMGEEEGKERKEEDDEGEGEREGAKEGEGGERE